MDFFQCLCNPQTRLTTSTSSPHHGPQWLCIASLPLFLLFTVVSSCHWCKGMNYPNSVFKWLKPSRPDWSTSRTLKASVLKQQSVMPVKNTKLILSLCSFLTPDWDCPQKPSTYVDGTTTRPKLPLLYHQANAHWEQRLIHHSVRPSGPHRHLQRGVNKFLTAWPERVFWWMFDSPAFSSKLLVQLYFACSVETSPRSPQWKQGAFGTDASIYGASCNSKNTETISGTSIWLKFEFILLFWSVPCGVKNPQPNVFCEKVYLFIYFSYFAAIDVFFNTFFAFAYPWCMTDSEQSNHCWSWHIVEFAVDLSQVFSKQWCFWLSSFPCLTHEWH